MKWLRQSISDHARTWIGARGRHILHGSAWALVARLAGAANLLLSIPLVLNSIGAASFGFWATLVSLALLGGSLDFGLGNGAMNLVAGAKGRQANHEIPQIIATARGPMILAGLLIGAIVGLTGTLLPWTNAPQLVQIPEDQMRTSVLVLAVAITLAVPLSLATKALMGLGDTAIAFKYQAAAQLCTLLLIAMLAARNAGLVALTSAALLTPLAGSLAQAVALKQRLPKSPSPTSQDLRGQIYRSGALFFLLQIAALAAFGLDLFIITSIVGPEATSAYAIAQRVFALIPLALGILWTPLWPAYAEAIAQGNQQWTLATFKKSIVLALAFSAPSAAAVASVLTYLSKNNLLNDVRLDATLIMGFAAWSTAEAFGGAIATFLNAAGILRIQVALALAFAAACMALKLHAATAIGIWAIPWFTLLAYTVFSLLPLYLLAPRIMAAAAISQAR